MGPRAGLDGRKISSPPGFDIYIYIYIYIYVGYVSNMLTTVFVKRKLWVFGSFVFRLLSQNLNSETNEQFLQNCKALISLENTLTPQIFLPTTRDDNMADSQKRERQRHSRHLVLGPKNVYILKMIRI